MKNTKWTAAPLLFKSLILVPVLGLCVYWFPACVTVNVNIPEGDIQQASDDYVRALYEAKEKPKPSPSPSASTEAKPSAMSLLIPYAEAAEQTLSPSINPSINTKSPKLDDLMTRMRSRLDRITALKKLGILGETNDGKLITKGKPSAAEKSEATNLVSETNRDRQELYREMLAHNGLSQTNIVTVERSFAHSFQKHSPPGTWIQDEDGSWSRKR